MQNKLFRLDIVLNNEDVELAQALIFQHIQHGWEEENLPEEKTLLRIHCELSELLNEVENLISATISASKMTRSEIENQDWTEAWKQYFTPVEAGSFIILPSWTKGEDAGSILIPLYIEPKSAFGTGHHATTTLCIEAISTLFEEEYIKQGNTFLDLGCGTGILGIACQKLGLHGLCADIDPLAISNTLENLSLNDLTKEIDTQTGSIDLITEKYDIVIANILANPLKELAPDIIKAVKNKGSLVLSGILSSQAEAVCTAYSALGKPQIKEGADIPHICPENIASDTVKPSESWVALIWTKI